MKRIYNIYVSTGGCVEKEKADIKNFFTILGYRIGRLYDICIQPLYSESEEAYKVFVPQSDYCLFLCSKDNQKQINKEISFVENFFGKDTEKKTFMFFKSPDFTNETAHKSLGQMSDYIKWYDLFDDNVDVIKSRVIGIIKYGIIKTLAVEISENICMVEGMACFNIDNLPETQKCEPLIYARTRLAEIKKEMECDLPKIKETGTAEEPEKAETRYRVRNNMYERRLHLKRRSLLKLYLKMMSFLVEDGLTDEQCQAYRMLLTGDAKAALKILDLDESRNKYEATKKRLNAQIPCSRTPLKSFLNNSMTYADIFFAYEDCEDAYALFPEYYGEDFLNMALEGPEGIDYLYYYLDRFVEYDDIDEILSVLYMLKEKSFWKSIPIEKKALFYAKAGEVCWCEKDKGAVMYYSKALYIYRELSKRSLVYAPYFAFTLLNLAEAKMREDVEKAMDYYEIAREAFAELAEKCPEKYTPFQAKAVFKKAAAKKDKAGLKEAFLLAKKYPNDFESKSIIMMIPLLLRG